MKTSKPNRYERGITIVALIITIIILVILAVVSINVMFGDRIIELATAGIDNYVLEQEKEEEKFRNAVEYINGVVNTNNKTILIGEMKVNKDLDENTGNWIQIDVNAVGKENTKLNYTLKLWKKENEEINEDELIKEVATREVTNENIESGEVVSLKIEGLEEYTEYLYRVEVSDKENLIEGPIGKTRTYCSGTSLQCSRYEM